MRITVNSRRAVDGFRAVKRHAPVPLVADIHFDYRLAIAAIDAGADKIRINPGNIGTVERVKAVVDAAKTRGVPIRIGVNSGSLQKEILARHGHPSPEALAESCVEYARLMESMGYENLVLSIKASDPLVTVEACRLVAVRLDYPQHIGITESGTVRTGTIRSAVGLGALLAEGIGDTLRVSLAGDPLHEVFAAKEILKSLGLAQGPVVIACPTCGRTQIDVAALAEKVEARAASLDVPIKIAVMGCVVNGPGEAAEADVGIAGGRGEGQVFVKGRAVATVAEDRLLDALWEYVMRVVEEKRGGSIPPVR